tara:strand:- start:11639 stop:11860 length:222 start_codon:yes stop_codon:yes gene_type:complete
MQFDRFPIFLGNERSSGMENGSFEVVSKIFIGKRFSRNEAFLRNAGECAEWDLANDYIKKPPYQCKKVFLFPI